MAGQGDKRGLLDCTGKVLREKGRRGESPWLGGWGFRFKTCGKKKWYNDVAGKEKQPHGEEWAPRGNRAARIKYRLRRC